MKKFTVFIILMASISLISFAKKDMNAWKSEKSLDQQFRVFKENLRYWDGSYFLNDAQFKEFFQAVNDSIAVMEKKVMEGNDQIKALKDELNSKIKETEEILGKLNGSIKRENTINVFGVDVNKSIYTLTMYLFILAVLAVAGSFFILFARSNKITKRIKKDYHELKEEYEEHKKNALERYVKMNIELTKTRFELNRKK